MATFTLGTCEHTLVTSSHARIRGRLIGRNKVTICTQSHIGYSSIPTFYTSWRNCFCFARARVLATSLTRTERQRCKKIPDLSISRFKLYNVCYRAFTLDVTAAILEFQNNETAAMFSYFVISASCVPDS